MKGTPSPVVFSCDHLKVPQKQKQNQGGSSWAQNHKHTGTINDFK